jgi:hypothetical protein
LGAKRVALVCVVLVGSGVAGFLRFFPAAVAADLEFVADVTDIFLQKVTSKA